MQRKQQCGKMATMIDSFEKDLLRKEAKKETPYTFILF